MLQEFVDPVRIGDSTPEFPYMLVIVNANDESEKRRFNIASVSLQGERHFRLERTARFTHSMIGNVFGSWTVGSLSILARLKSRPSPGTYEH